MPAFLRAVHSIRVGVSVAAIGASTPFLGCAASSVQEATVKAIRYRTFIVESAMDFVHGGGRWHDALFLPDWNLVVHVVWQAEMVLQPELPRMHAFEGERWDASESPWHQGSAEAKRVPEEVRIPATLAAEIVELAELTRRQKTLADRLGIAAVEAKVVGGQESVKYRH